MSMNILAIGAHPDDVEMRLSLTSFVIVLCYQFFSLLYKSAFDMSSYKNLNSFTRSSKRIA